MRGAKAIPLPDGPYYLDNAKLHESVEDIPAQLAELVA
jgi:hypothetical protein